MADWGKARAVVPEVAGSDKASFWIDYFQHQPDALTELLGEIYLITKAHDAGGAHGGRRARTINGNLDDLWDMLTPQYASEPFGMALRQLIGGEPLRSFAAKVPMDYSFLSRLMNGQRPIIDLSDVRHSMARLESIAVAAKVHPAYFLEWRELYVLDAVSHAIRTKPNVSISLMRKLQDGNARSRLEVSS